jgi:hypothetical protein
MIVVLMLCRKGKEGHLFDVTGKFLWGLTIILGSCYLIAGPYSQVLVPKSVVSFSDSLLIHRSFYGLHVEHHKPNPAGR